MRDFYYVQYSIMMYYEQENAAALHIKRTGTEEGNSCSISASFSCALGHSYSLLIQKSGDHHQNESMKPFGKLVGGFNPFEKY